MTHSDLQTKQLHIIGGSNRDTDVLENAQQIYCLDHQYADWRLSQSIGRELRNCSTAE